jgi:hypothetical protein
VGGPVRLAVFVGGIVIVGGVAVSVFTTLVVPRASSSRLMRTIARVLGRTVRRTMLHLGSYETKDHVLSFVGPLAMVLLFVLWLGFLVLGFGLMTWWVSGSTLTHAIEISGSSVFTLGIATSGRAGAQSIEFVSAGMGLLVIALEIAYLPTMYAAFSARESAVTLLATRSGTPAWGPEILARHHWFRTTSELPDLYREWEQWSAEVSESHTNYPALMWFRSPVPMLDAAALHDAVSPGAAPRQARICLAMGVGCLRSLASALRIPFDPDPLPTTPIRLTLEEFADGYRRLEEVEFPLERSLEESYRHFSGWRTNYEPIADALTMIVVPPPAPWLVARPQLGRVSWPTVYDRTPDDPTAGAPKEKAGGS